MFQREFVFNLNLAHLHKNTQEISDVQSQILLAALTAQQDKILEFMKWVDSEIEADPRVFWAECMLFLASFQ